MLAKVAHPHVAELDRDRAGFDLGEIEDVVDQAEQIRPCGVDGSGELGLLLVQIALWIVGEQLG